MIELQPGGATGINAYNKEKGWSESREGRLTLPKVNAGEDAFQAGVHSE